MTTLVAATFPLAVWAQEAPVEYVDRAGEAVVCGQTVPDPKTLPPPESGPVVYQIVPCFPTQGGASFVEPESYLYYIQLRPSLPSQGRWVPYDDDARQTMLADFRRLWGTRFLDDLSIAVEDHRFANGVIGKLVIYNMEERERVKVVEYVGAKHIDRTKIDEQLKEKGIELRPDSFLDDGTVRRIETTVRGLLADKGYTSASVTHKTSAVAGGPKLINLTFFISEGPKARIQQVDFIGNKAVSDRRLQRKLKGNKPAGLLSFLTGTGTYQEAAFAEDAEKILEHYRNLGYVNARVGRPELQVIEETADGKTRAVRLRIPITEGARYRLGDFTLDGNSVVKSEALRPMFKVKAGEWYREKDIRDGLKKVQEAYGGAGYMEFTGFPDLTPKGAETAGEAGVVDVTMRLQEGAQYLVNRITFTGNTITRDAVIRRELQLFEGSVFNTEALKYSIRRLNQLGYFKPVESQEHVLVDKVPGDSHKVDVTLKLEEQNRNQVTFGAGFSGYDGMFVNASYSTTNFLGRGETFQVSLQTGARSNNYQFSATRPYVFDRPISAGLNLFSRKIDYYTSPGTLGYSEVRGGAELTGGVALGRFARFFTALGYEVIDSAALGDDLTAVSTKSGQPVFSPFLDEGRHIESRVSPSLVYNTVDHPITPRRGMRMTAGIDVAGSLFGGTVQYLKPNLEGILYIPHFSRTGLGLRAQGGWIIPLGSTERLPYYRRFFLGGEYQIRGVDVHTVGPTASGRAIGGDKFVLFNAEYYLDIAKPVRALAFHDAGQTFEEGQRLDLAQLRTSSGFEVRVMVPVINVPFRLIWAWNIYRDTFQPERAFKFAVGTTF